MKVLIPILIGLLVVGCGEKTSKPEAKTTSPSTSPAQEANNTQPKTNQNHKTGENPEPQKVMFDWSKVDSQPERAKHIARELRVWRSLNPKKEGKKLRVVYFHPKDRLPLKNYEERWDRIMADIQQFYREQMRQLGYGEITLSLEQERGKLKLHTVSYTHLTLPTIYSV